MRVAFDAAAADGLVQAAQDGATSLRGQGVARRGAAELAAEHFAGVYARRFADCAVAESGDRADLARALDDLAMQVGVIARQAAAEDRRRADLSAWEQRDAERRRGAAADPTGQLAVVGAVFVDPRPSDVPIRPAPIDARFRPRARERTGGGTSAGRSSADPHRLRRAVQASRAADTVLGDALTRLRGAWGTFHATCDWAPVGDVTVMAGFARYLTENADDAAWTERIAAAFERAGGTHRLSNATLDIATTLVPGPSLDGVLAPGISAADVAARWPNTGYSRDDLDELRALPLAVLTQLGNLEGLPYWVRDAANRVVLRERLAALRRQGLEGSSEFASLDNVRKALTAAKGDGRRTLISLTADQPPLAAVAIGDLDSATNVTWAVPGMGSSTAQMTGWTDAAQNLSEEQGRRGGPRDRAVIAWVGYHAPPAPVTGGLDFGVFDTRAASVGGTALAASIRGLDAARSGNPPRTNVLGHSYGTTTAALALTAPGVHVDSVTFLASAGIPDRIPSAAALHADQVFAGQARNVAPFIEPGRGDQWAATGRDWSHDHHEDPTDPDFGATAFGTDGDDGSVGVGDHGVWTKDGTGYLDPGTESLRNAAYATTDQPGQLTGHHPKGPTVLEQALLDSANTRMNN